MPDRYIQPPTGGWLVTTTKHQRRYARHRERLLAASNAYYEAHKDDILAKRRAYYGANREKIIASTRQRYLNDPGPIKAANDAYRKTEKGREVVRQAVRKYVAKNPEKVAAHLAVNRAIRRGELKREPCATCGASKVDGHHHDYSKPLDVTWLCRDCHKTLHRK